MIDVDDELEEDSLKNLSKLELGEINVFNYRTFDSKGRFITNNDCVQEELKTSLKKNKELLLQDTASWHFVFQTSFLKQQGIYFLTNKLYEDFNWNLKILKSASQIYTYKISIYKYYLTDGSIMRNTNLDRRKEIFDVFNDVLRINPNAQLLEDYLSYLNDFFPQWSKNKYFNKISCSRRMLIYCIKYRLKFILSLLTKVLR